MSRSHGRELASVTVIAVQTSFGRSSLMRMSNDDLNVFKQSEKTWQWMMIMSGVFTLRCELLLVVHNLEEVKWITAAAVFCDAELVKGAQRSRRQRQPLYCWLLEWRHLAPCPAMKLVDYANVQDNEDVLHTSIRSSACTHDVWANATQSDVSVCTIFVSYYDDYDYTVISDGHDCNLSG